MPRPFSPRDITPLFVSSIRYWSNRQAGSGWGWGAAAAARVLVFEVGVDLPERPITKQELDALALIGMLNDPRTGSIITDDDTVRRARELVTNYLRDECDAELQEDAAPVLPLNRTLDDVIADIGRGTTLDPPPGAAEILLPHVEPDPNYFDLTLLPLDVPEIPEVVMEDYAAPPPPELLEEEHGEPPPEPHGEGSEVHARIVRTPKALVGESIIGSRTARVGRIIKVKKAIKVERRETSGRSRA